MKTLKEPCSYCNLVPVWEEAKRSQHQLYQADFCDIRHYPSFCSFSLCGVMTATKTAYSDMVSIPFRYIISFLSFVHVFSISTSSSSSFRSNLSDIILSVRFSSAFAVRRGFFSGFLQEYEATLPSNISVFGAIPERVVQVAFKPYN